MPGGYTFHLATPTVGIALPWCVATELVVRLSALLTSGPTPEAPHLGVAPPDDLAPFLVRLSSRVAEEISWVDDDDIVDDTKINGRRYLLVRACDAWRAAELLHHANSILTEDEHSAGRDWTDRFGDLAASDRHTFLWEPDPWIDPPGQ